MKKISVIIPCYNQEKYIAETINSVLEQTFKDFEIIIVNDGSTDNTYTIITDFQKKYPQLITIINQENKGLPATRNAAIQRATGEYIFPLDGDDKIAPTCLEKLYSAINQNFGDVIHCNIKTFDKIEEPIFLLPPNKLNFVKQNCLVCSALYKKSDWEKYHGYDETMKGGLEDWDFWLNFVEDNKKFYKINEYLFLYRKSNISMTSSTKEKYKKLENYIFTKRQNLKKWKILGRKITLLYRQKVNKKGVVITKIFGIPIYRSVSFNK